MVGLVPPHHRFHHLLTYRRVNQIQVNVVLQQDRTDRGRVFGPYRNYGSLRVHFPRSPFAAKQYIFYSLTSKADILHVKVHYRILTRMEALEFISTRLPGRYIEKEKECAKIHTQAALPATYLDVRVAMKPC